MGCRLGTRAGGGAPVAFNSVELNVRAMSASSSSTPAAAPSRTDSSAAAQASTNSRPGAVGLTSSTLSDSGASSGSRLARVRGSASGRAVKWKRQSDATSTSAAAMS